MEIYLFWDFIFFLLSPNLSQYLNTSRKYSDMPKQQIRQENTTNFDIHNVRWEGKSHLCRTRGAPFCAWLPSHVLAHTHSFVRLIVVLNCIWLCKEAHPLRIWVSLPVPFLHSSSSSLSSSTSTWQYFHFLLATLRFLLRTSYFLWLTKWPFFSILFFLRLLYKLFSL